MLELAERLMSTQDLADLLGVPAATLRQWRHKGTGPRGIRVGKHIRYRPTDVDAWLEQHADETPEGRRV